MTRRRRLSLVFAVVATVLVAPAAACAHAYPTKTVPSASSGILSHSPPVVAITYDEPVEPRFAIFSVTDVDAHSETTGPVSRSASDPDTLQVPLRHLAEGWYLVYWRVISVDGHPVQGAFTFEVGPNPGPIPQFIVPHIAGTATSPSLVVAKWAVFLTVLVAIGLFFLRIGIARPLVRRVEGTSLRKVTTAFVVACVLGLVAVPVYLLQSTAIDSLHSFWNIGALVPLFRVTAFGRGYVDLELCFALFCVAAWTAVWVDRPEREHRSIAELLALSGAVAAALAVLLIPGLVGHAAQTAPHALAVLLDWLHVVAGSLWLGGLVGLLVLWQSLPAARRIEGLAVVVPRFSNVAFVSVLVLLASGTWASILHLPILAALWETSYGKVILIKVALLVVAALLGAVNLTRTKPRLLAARTHPELGRPAAQLLQRVVTGEAAILVGAVFAAALLSSLAPPPPAFAQENSAQAKVGPGKVAEVVHQDGYTLTMLVSPNKAAVANSFALKLTKGGKPVRGADVTLTFAMLDMEMQNQEFQLTETAPGVYSHAAPALVMVGHWGLSFNVTPRQGTPFSALIVDHAAG